MNLIFGVHLFGTADEVELPEPVMSRLICHALLHQLPEEAMSEAVSTLTEMWRYYQVPPTRPAMLEPTRFASVRITGTADAPKFSVTEE